MVAYTPPRYTPNGSVHAIAIVEASVRFKPVVSFTGRAGMYAKHGSELNTNPTTASALA